MRIRGEGSVYPSFMNGKPCYRAVKNLTERFVVDGKEVKRKKQIKGTGPTPKIALERREEAYKRYLVKTGEADIRILAQTPAELALKTGEWLDTWISKVKQGDKVQSNTVFRYEATINNHIKPHIGSVPIRLLDNRILEKLLFETLPAKRKLRKTKTGFVTTDEQLLGNSPMRKIYDILNQSLTRAVRDDIIMRNPMDKIDRILKSKPKNEGIDKLTWLPARILEHLHGTDKEALAIFQFYGLRQGERLGIEHSSFTYLNNPRKMTLLKIDRQLSRDDVTGRIFVKPDVKTYSSERLIPLSPQVTTILLQWKKQQDEWKKLPTWKPREGLENLFFTTKTGTPILPQMDNKNWHKLLLEVTTPKNGRAGKAIYIRQHACRHITATLFGKENVNSLVVRSLLGWSTELMRTYYTHLGVTDKIEPINVLTDSIFADWNKKESKMVAADAQVAVEAGRVKAAKMEGLSLETLLSRETEAKDETEALEDDEDVEGDENEVSDVSSSDADEVLSIIKTV